MLKWFGEPLNIIWLTDRSIDHCYIILDISKDYGNHLAPETLLLYKQGGVKTDDEKGEEWVQGLVLPAGDEQPCKKKEPGRQDDEDQGEKRLLTCT